MKTRLGSMPCSNQNWRLKRRRRRESSRYLVDIWVIVQGDESEGHFIPCTRLYTEFRHLGLCRPGSGCWRLRRQHLETMQESISWCANEWKIELFDDDFKIWVACGVPLYLAESSHFFFTSHRHTQKKSLRVRVRLSVRIRTYMPPLSILFRDVGSWDTTLRLQEKKWDGANKSAVFQPHPDEWFFCEMCIMDLTTPSSLLATTFFGLLPTSMLTQTLRRCTPCWQPHSSLSTSPYPQSFQSNSTRKK